MTIEDILLYEYQQRQLRETGVIQTTTDACGVAVPMISLDGQRWFSDEKQLHRWHREQAKKRREIRGLLSNDANLKGPRKNGSQAYE